MVHPYDSIKTDFLWILDKVVKAYLETALDILYLMNVGVTRGTGSFRSEIALSV